MLDAIRFPAGNPRFTRRRTSSPKVTIDAQRNSKLRGPMLICGKRAEAAVALFLVRGIPEKGDAMPKTFALACAALLLAGCATSEPPGSAVGDDLPPYMLGDDTVQVSEVNSTSAAFSEVEDLLAIAGTVIVGTVIATDDVAVEAPVDRNAEGVAEGEGPDIYGRITFRVREVIKGDAGLTRVQIYYESGKRDGEDKTKRIAYTYEGLRFLQRSDATLKAPTEVDGQQFLVLAQSNRKTAVGGFQLIGSMGLAQVAADGTLSWPGPPGSSPVTRNGSPVPLKLADIRAAG
ncbi:hypothetical protein [Actinoplanes sp. M2I2]|uniref:hypothetical protein n=1 Tax=Actinoplanes sp. M2I2 TaxID=1734444 RepID=UPI0020226B9D|nr:hypothetical protein [Actinoplanes sp. M2I2]